MKIGLAHLIDDAAAALAEETRAFNAAAQATAADQPQPDLSTPAGLDEARRLLPQRAALARAVDQVARVGERSVPVRIVVPAEGAAKAAYLDIHGGGFYLGSAARGDARNALLADASGMTVVSVDYRLAPEHPWPAAPDDCETAALWLLEQSETLFGMGRLVIGGASAGANLAMTTLLRLRDRGRIDQFIGAVLQFGTFDLSGSSPGGRVYADEQFIQAYAGHVRDRTNPDVSPLYGDLRGLPPTLLVAGTLDFVFEDTVAMAARLSAAGNEVDLRVYPEATHGFTSFPSAMATAAMKAIESWLAGRLDDR